MIDLIDFVFLFIESLDFQNLKLISRLVQKNRKGRDEDWEEATSSLINALKKKNIPFGKRRRRRFYGPKIEFNIKDSLGRMWQCGTIQIDFRCQRDLN